MDGQIVKIAIQTINTNEHAAAIRGISGFQKELKYMKAFFCMYFSVFIYVCMYVCMCVCMYVYIPGDFGIPGGLAFSALEAEEISFAAQVNFLAPNSLSHL